MSLAVAASITLGRERYDTHAAAVEVVLGLLPAPDVARVRFPAGVSPREEPGDDAVVALDGGDGARTVLTGRLRAVRRGLHEVVVTIAGGAADLGALRPAVTFDRRGAADVIAALAREAGVAVGEVDIDLPLAAYAAVPGRTAAEHVAALSRLGGAVVRFDADDRLQVTGWPLAGPDAMLRHGREPLTYAAERRPGDPARRVAIGHGPAGSVEAPDALRPTVDALPGGVPEPGPDAVWEPAPILRTPAAALGASRAIDRAFRAADGRLQARCFLLPALRPGQTVRCADLPAGVGDGPWLLRRVVHRIAPERGGTTELWGWLVGDGPLAAVVGGLF